MLPPCDRPVPPEPVPPPDAGRPGDGGFLPADPVGRCPPLAEGGFRFSGVEDEPAARPRCSWASSALKEPRPGAGGLRLWRRHIPVSPGASGPADEHEVLLDDLDRVRGRPVQDQARREAESDEPEEDRHDPRKHLLLLLARSRRRGALHLPLLIERGGDHQREKDVVRDAHRGPVSAIKFVGSGLLQIRDGLDEPLADLHLLPGLARAAHEVHAQELGRCAGCA